MEKKSYFYITSFIFLVVGIIHIIRIATGFEIQIMGYSYPRWLSILEILIAFYLMIDGYKLGKKELKIIQRVRAIIIKDGKVLLMHRIKSGLEYWVFPGGGLEETDKSAEDGLKRECLEELGVEVEVKDLFMEIESVTPSEMGQMQYFYECKILSGKVGTGTGPEFGDRDIDKYGTYKVEWISLNEIKNMVVYPIEVRDKIV